MQPSGRRFESDRLHVKLKKKYRRMLDRFSWFGLGAVSTTVPFVFHGWVQGIVLVATISIGVAVLERLFP